MGKSFRLKSLCAVIAASLGGIVTSPLVAASDPIGSAQTAAQSPSSPKTYLVEFTDEGALHYDGGIGTLQGSSQRSTGDRNFDAKRAEVQAYVAYLENAVAMRTASIASRLGRSIHVTHRFFYTHAGIALTLDEAEAADVAGMSGVKSVIAGTEHAMDTFRGPQFIGADTIWNLATPGGATNLGAGVRIAVLDSGTNSQHPSFANEASCGFSIANPKLVAASCATATGPGGACNGPNPEADAVSTSHGVHTASTAGGNILTASTVPAPTLPSPFTQMSGVAPCAGINSFKVCNTAQGTCLNIDAIAAANNAIADIATGIRVLTFSVGGGTSPWSTSDTNRAFLDAVNAGIFVATSAGNTRTETPNPVGAVHHRGPWVLTVANSYHDLNPAAKVGISGPTSPVNLQNLIMNKGSTTPVGSALTNHPIRTYAPNIAGCNDTGGIPAGHFSGAIAIVRRGASPPSTTACGFLEKINNAFNAGAVAVIVTNNQAGAISMDTTSAPAVPAYSISSQTVGDNLIAYLNANPTTAAAYFDPTGFLPDKLNDGSLRGPTPGVLADLTKPDISGPGTSIYAAARTENGSYVFMSGTSMSTPHVSGGAALLRAIHPTWTPMEVKSALQMTAKKTGWKDDGSAPWDADDAGSGRVHLGNAIAAGLVMDETFARFVAANPSGGSLNVRDLNLASVRNMNCTPSCTFTRVVRNALPSTATWNVTFDSISSLQATVAPSTFTLPPGATIALTITTAPPAYGTPIAAPTVGFGYINLIEVADRSPAQHITVAIRGSGDGIFRHGFDD